MHTEQIASSILKSDVKGSISNEIKLSATYGKTVTVSFLKKNISVGEIFFFKICLTFNQLTNNTNKWKRMNYSKVEQDQRLKDLGLGNFLL